MELDPEPECDAFSRAFARQNRHFETAIQSLDSLNEQIAQFFLSSQSDGHLNEDPLTAARWSHQYRHSMALMRRLLCDARAQFRKMMSDNMALAARIDRDIRSAHLRVSALRGELALTNRRIIDYCMAGNVITTCMPPPTSTTTTVAVSGASRVTVGRDEDAPSRPSSSPPVADKGGTRTTDQSSKPVTAYRTPGADDPKTAINSPTKSGQSANQTSPDKPTTSVSQSPGSRIPDPDTKTSNEEFKVQTKAYSGLQNSCDIRVSKDKTINSPAKTSNEEHKEIQHRALSGLLAKTDKQTESLTESSEASEDASASRHRKRRSPKGSDVQKASLPDETKSHDLLDDPKSDLQRSESDGNQNSAPECDLSIGGSPFKEEDPKLDKSVSSSSDSKSVQPKTTSDFNNDLHRSSPPVKDVSDSLQCFSFLGESTPFSKEGQNRCRAKTKSDPLDKRRDNRGAVPEFSVLSSPSSVMRHKTGVSKVEDRKVLEESWYKTREDPRAFESSSKGETSDSQDGLSSDFLRDGRYVVFDSRRHQRPWRCARSDGFGDRGKSHEDNKFDDKGEVPEKDDQSGAPRSNLAQESSCFRKPLNLDYSYSGAAIKDAPDLSSEVDALRIRNSALLRDLEEVMESRDDKARENAALQARLEQTEKELRHAREALVALKQDRKRLKAEKFDLLTQMKQLYGTLEDKEEELREFIRNYEQKIKESEESIKQKFTSLEDFIHSDEMAKDREEMEQEKWTILKRARDESERAVLLCTQIGIKDAHIKELQEELTMMQDKHQQTASNGFGSPGSYRTSNGVDSTPTPTPGSPSPSYTPTLSYQTSPHKGVSMAPSPDHPRPSLLSRSAEDIFPLSAAKKPGPKEKKGTWGSISRVFSRSRRRKPLHPELFESNRQSWSSPKESPLSEEGYAQKLRLLEEAQGTPMQHWRAATVLAWLEINMDMPQYGALCAENVKSGKVLLELSEPDLEEGLGISNPMHRRKLRLAIEEHRQPSLCRYPKICQMTHSWVLEEWLPSIGLPCYLPSFSEHLVDGRVLDTLTRKDLEKHFGVSRKFHQLSILHAVQLLRMLNFDRQLLQQRRLNCEQMDVDPLVWTNGRLMRWASSIDLGEYAENLRGTGVHGALAVLEPSFTADTIATALGIPTSKNIIRRHLTTEWQNLIQPARLSLESESVVAKKSKSEKRLASGSSSTSLVSQGRGGNSGIMSSYARRTLDRYDRRRSSWRFSTWRSSQESLKSTTSKKTPPTPTAVVERPRLLPLSPSGGHRRTFSSHSDVETLTVTPV